MEPSTRPVFRAEALIRRCVVALPRTYVGAVYFLGGVLCRLVVSGADLCFYRVRRAVVTVLKNHTYTSGSSICGCDMTAFLFLSELSTAPLSHEIDVSTYEDGVE